MAIQPLRAGAPPATGAFTHQLKDKLDRNEYLPTVSGKVAAEHVVAGGDAQRSRHSEIDTGGMRLKLTGIRPLLEVGVDVISHCSGGCRGTVTNGTPANV